MFIIGYFVLVAVIWLVFFIALDVSGLLNTILSFKKDKSHSEVDESDTIRKENENILDSFYTRYHHYKDYGEQKHNVCNWKDYSDTPISILLDSLPTDSAGWDYNDEAEAKLEALLRRGVSDADIDRYIGLSSSSTLTKGEILLKYSHLNK